MVPLGLCYFVPLLSQKILCPCNAFVNALSRGLSSNPQFKVFNPIVVAYSVLVMNCLRLFERATQVLLHYKPMLKYGIPATKESGAHVPLIINCPFALCLIGATHGTETPIPVVPKKQLRLDYLELFLAKQTVSSRCAILALRLAFALERAINTITNVGGERFAASLTYKGRHGSYYTPQTNVRSLEPLR